MSFQHTSVMLNQAIASLNIKPNGVYVDLTLGGGGHSLAIAQRLDKGRLIGFDRDMEAIAAAKERLAGYNAEVIHDSFENVDKHNISGADGVLADLGVSSHQLDVAARGFSYMSNAPLDMRMDTTAQMTAQTVVNEYSQERLCGIFYKYGEERYSQRIARRILQRREKAPITTTSQLVDIIKEAVPTKALYGAGHPAKRVFQAIRIEVNGELNQLKTMLEKAFDLLNANGRMVIISFHSLEDRMVKEFFKGKASGCICPADLPVCGCGIKPLAKLITKKAMVPDIEETKSNSRAQSARLRVLERIDQNVG